MIPTERLQQIKDRFAFIEAKMNTGVGPDELASLSKEYSDLRPVIETIEGFEALQSARSEAELLVDDPDMRE